MNEQNRQQIHPMELALRRYGIIDKDAQALAEKQSESLAEQRKKIRAMRPDAEIDLHGLTTDEAEIALNNFFSAAAAQRLRKIAIIHGKGNHSEGEAILKKFVKNYLEGSPLAGECTHPKSKDGGSGTTWVILKHPKKQI
ncbi:Smr/MutS family protein [Treponema phagedenis]|nr:Smr/MutS family protein [Treponema phagedenis]